MRLKNLERRWDALVIGSGVGALTCAAFLGKVRKKKVLVLERHTKIGGFTHTFTRKADYEFDIGVHYVGELRPGSELKGVLDFLTGGRLQWRALPDEYDRLIFPEFEWAIPSSPEAHLARLVERFPRSSAALKKYFALEKKIAEAYSVWQFAERFSRPVCAGVRRYLQWRRPEMFFVTKDYFDRVFEEPELKAIMTARWMGFGIPPQRSSLGMHCLHGHHYSGGAWYPVGGGRAIAEHLSEPILAAGGQIVTRAEVTRILRDGERAVGVVLADGTELLSDLVISNAGARKTYLEMLDSSAPVSFRQELKESEIGTSVLSLFMTLKNSPRTFGFEPANYWFCSMTPPKIFDPASQDEQSLWGFLSFPSLKSGSNHHTAQVIVMCENRFFERWRDTRWRRRPEDYEKLKSVLAETILRDLEKRFPGFTSEVEYSELSTPLSVAHFQGAPSGSVYGVPSTPERFQMPWTQASTPLKGLYLTGSDVFSPGISGSIFGGLKTFEVISLA